MPYWHWKTPLKLKLKLWLRGCQILICLWSQIFFLTYEKWWGGSGSDLILTHSAPQKNGAVGLTHFQRQLISSWIWGSQPTCHSSQQLCLNKSYFGNPFIFFKPLELEKSKNGKISEEGSPWVRKPQITVYQDLPFQYRDFLAITILKKLGSPLCCSVKPE